MRGMLVAGLAALVLVVPSSGQAAVASPALTGKWHLSFKQLSRVHIVPPTSTRRTWIFRNVTAHGQQVKQLLFGLSHGGYEHFTLRRRGATTWVGTRHGVGPYCRTKGKYVGTGTESVSIHITDSAVVDGIETATALEAYYRATLNGGCNGLPVVAHEVRRYRGTPAPDA